jgi:hypothetical protein
VLRSEQAAAYLFDFAWSGRVQGRPAAGEGRGSAVLVRVGDAWTLLVEHLGPAP